MDTAPFFEQIQTAMRVIIVLNGTCRQNIIELLKQSGNNPKNIGYALNMESSHVSAHLAILREWNIVTWKQQGVHKVYSLNKPRLEQLEHAVKQFVKYAAI